MNATQPQVISVKRVKPLYHLKRVAERFSVGANAWISFDARKAIPVIITEVDDRHYSVQIIRAQRSVTRAGNIHSLFLDEVRSTPEAACLNCVTL